MIPDRRSLWDARLGALSRQAIEDIADRVVGEVLEITRAPGGAVAVVVGGEARFAKGYGVRTIAGGQVTAATRYPIASTTKAVNATLIGMLVDEGRLDWDGKIGSYLPGFRFRDRIATEFATLRDLIAMRTGLPRHDWVWKGYPTTRAELATRLGHLEPAGEFRDRFRYNNLTATLAGHVAEVTCGATWEELVASRIFEPLKMLSSSFSRPECDDVTGCHHETLSRDIVSTVLLSTEATAPSGGAIWSNVEDMARWAAFNLHGGVSGSERLISGTMLAEIQSPHVVVGNDATSPSPGAAYGLGWFIDHYEGCRRVSHGGYLHDVSSDVTLFPDLGLGLVSFLNFGCPLPARVVNERLADSLLGLAPARSLAGHLASYEAKIAGRASCNDQDVASTYHAPGELGRYAGRYCNPGYGDLHIHIGPGPRLLDFERGDLRERLEHSVGDIWRFVSSERYPIHVAHPFERSNAVVFGQDATGLVDAVSLRLEPAASPVHFVREG